MESCLFLHLIMTGFYSKHFSVCRQNPTCSNNLCTCLLRLSASAARRTAWGTAGNIPCEHTGQISPHGWNHTLINSTYIARVHDNHTEHILNRLSSSISAMIHIILIQVIISVSRCYGFSQNNLYFGTCHAGKLLKINFS